MAESPRQRLQRWKADPVAFVCECFGMTTDQSAPPEHRIDAWQIQVLRAFPKHQRIAVPAAKGCGKTCVEAWLIWNFMATRPNPNVAATSISSDQLQDGLWKELAKWQQKSPFLMACFEWQKTRIVSRELPATWWASARSWAKNADPTAQSLTMAGLHAEHMLFVLDESGGIPMPLLATAEAALSSGIECKLLQMGNTTTLDGPLHLACTSHSEYWYVVHVTGDPDDPNRSPRISKQWAREQIKLFGRENPWVKVNVFGEFPAASLNSLLGADEVRAAMARNVPEDQYSWAQRRIGVDVARFGDDRTITVRRQGLRCWPFKVLRNERTTTIAAHVLMEIKDFGRGSPVLTFIDDTGHWGHGVVDNCIAAGVTVIPVQYHAPGIDPRYKNRRAEGWMEMAEWVKRGGCLPNDPELIGELTTPTYSFANGVFLLEDKDLIKARLGRSPDKADALAETFMLQEMPAMDESGRLQTVGGGQTQDSGEFDPFREEE